MRKLLFLLILTILPLLASAETVEIDGIYYNLNAEAKTAEVTKNPNEYSGKVVIPESITSDKTKYSVTSIGEYAFWRCSSMTSVTIPSSVIYIGEYAFWDCSSMTSVTIPSSVTSIGEAAFWDCSSMTSVTIPNSMTSIGKRLFEDCSGLTSVNIPNSVTSIGEDAFSGCNGLTTIEIPNSVTSIGESAFSRCIGLTSIEIPNSVTSIGEGAFYGCSGLTSVSIGNNVTSIGQVAFAECSSLSSLNISNSVCSIGIEAFRSTAWYNGQDDGLVYAGLVAYDYKGNMSENTTIVLKEGTKGIAGCAFSGCDGLTSIEIPNSVICIGSEAFNLCYELTSINIPQSVTQIDGTLFRGCTSLSSIIVEKGNTKYDSRNNCNAIIETKENSLIAGCKNTIIPDDVVSIGNNAFELQENLTSISIPYSVTSIGKYAFDSCRGLQSIIISNNVSFIGEYAFCDCNNLTSVTLPDKLTSISDELFRGCSRLATVSIPQSVTYIGSWVFRECYELKTIICLATTVPYTSKDAFNKAYPGYIIPFSKEDGIILYVPAGSTEAYASNDLWNIFEIRPLDETESCDLSDLPTSSSYYAATSFLCERTVLSGSKPGGKTNVNDPLLRSHLAKIAFRGVYLLNGRQVPLQVVSDKYPTVYDDIAVLTSSNEYYYQAARALLYLEYGDGVSPFDRNRLKFEPDATISRVNVLKVLMEAFNIKPDVDGTDNPFPNDENVVKMTTSNPLRMGYIRKAAALGIITTANDEFRPYANCIRGEAFVMLGRIMQKIEAGEIDDPKPQESDYFEPLNTTLKTISLGASLQMGNFQHYTKTSFALSGVVPLAFSHAYNSYNTTLPSVFYGDKSKTDVDDSYLPLGDGWSHNYHSFITVVGDYQNNAADNGLRAIVHWGGGSIDVYKSDGSQIIPESMGIYDEFTFKDDEVLIKSKSQMEYRFSKQGGSGAAVFYLYSIRDRNGNELTINYEDGQNGNMRISSVSDGNRELKFSYLEGTDLLSEVKDPLSRSIKFDYFSNEKTGKKQLKTFTDAEGNTTTYDYVDLSKVGTSKLLSRIQLPKGNYIENEYDANCRLKKSESGINGVPTTKTSVNVQTNYGSGSISTKSQVEVERGLQTSTYNYTYNENNVVTGMTGAKDMFVNSSYGNADHPELPTSIESNSTEVSDICYDAKGNVTSITVSGDGTLTTTMTYDDMNNVTSRTDPMGNKTTYSYDGNGNLTEVSAPEGVTASISVNSKGLPTETSNAMGVRTEYDYNEYGNLIKTTLPALGLSSTAVYDAASRLTSATDALGRTSSFVYNNNDYLTSETDAMDHTTQYAYDKNDNLTSITNAKGGVTTMSYDNATDWLLSVEFAGAKKQYDYNKDGTLSTFTKPDGTTLSYDYDELGRITDDGVNSYSYDGQLRLSQISGERQDINYTYDGFNRITKVHYDGISNYSNNYTYDKNGNCTSVNDTQYDYDGLNRLTSVKFSGGTISYSYRKDSKLSMVEYPNGMTTTFDYDEVGRLTNKQTKLSNGTVVAGYSYILDKVGNITEQTSQEPYTDIVLPNEETNYSYNDGNRITKAGDISFEFDANGNTTKRGDETFSWDEKDRLTAAGSTAIKYDPLGLIASYGDITFTTDPLGMGNVLSDSKSGAEYIYGNGLEARVKNGKASYYVTDVRGSVVAIVDEDGNITHKYQYDEFGKVVQKEEADYNPFQYVGKYGVMALNDHQYYMRARHYDPTIGRFLSEDPIWSMNLYPYSENNPIMGIDPLGLTDLELTRKFGDVVEKTAGGQGIKTFTATPNPVNQKGLDLIKSKEAICKAKDEAEAASLLNKIITPAYAPINTAVGVVKTAQTNDPSHYYQGIEDDAWGAVAAGAAASGHPLVGAGIYMVHDIDKGIKAGDPSLSLAENYKRAEEAGSITFWTINRVGDFYDYIGITDAINSYYMNKYNKR